MKKVTVLILEQSLPTGITAISDIFRMAGVNWDENPVREMSPLFKVETVSIDGKPIRYNDYIEITPHRSIADVDATDLIIVPSSGYRVDGMGNYPKELTRWLGRHHDMGTDIAGLCTGVFLLAEAGLLSGKNATTHWGYARTFKKKYPDVFFKPERILTEDGNLFCSGGGSAGIDMCLHLIDNYYGPEVANKCAKVLLLDRGRDFQTPYRIFHVQKKHQDSDILRAQQWIEENFSNSFIVDDVASQVGMSLRNFKRRFKLATGDSPLVYLQRLRVEAAKNVLENGNKRIDEIAGRVGYEDVGFFRKLFLRYAGVSPSDYRQKYNHQLK